MNIVRDEKYLCSRDFKYKKCCLLPGTENMNKSKVTHEIDDFLDSDDSEHVVAMLDFMKMQHSCALELTKLIIDKCHDLKFTKDTRGRHTLGCSAWYIMLSFEHGF